ncbi:topoisomerase C-terminal repeat-containing protein, partial [Nocardioides sp. NPDC127514]|uniref:topoisomerase C-terminal repeat-containing protein n=1 Tax=Nocardioides sp. NPDC127514 TaxID=3154243 RepID=UPI003325D71C
MAVLHPTEVRHQSLGRGSRRCGPRLPPELTPGHQTRRGSGCPTRRFGPYVTDGEYNATLRAADDLET